MAVVGITATFAAGAHLLLPKDNNFVPGLFLGIAIGMFWTVWDDPPEYIEHWREGSAGEARTGVELAKLESGGWHAVHDLPDTYGDIDHVAIGPGGVFLLNTKVRRGRLAFEDGALVQRRPISPRSVFRHRGLPRSMRGSAASLRRRLSASTGLDQRIHAVVVIWGDFSQGVVDDDQVFYVHGERLAEWLSTWPETVPRRVQNLFALALESGMAVAAPTQE
jgi:hypothetical protein